jgi:outer membrane murein-binding lipoprotein Lpp
MVDQYGILAALNTWMLTATMVFAVLTGIMVFLTIGKSKRLIDQFSEDAQNYRKQVKSLEKTAEGIRKELFRPSSIRISINSN